MTLTLPISGMTCAACVRRVELQLSRAAPQAQVAVNLATESALIEGPVPSPAALIAAVEKAGFDVPTRSHHLQLTGLSCAACAGRVETALRAVPGVLSAQVNPASDRALVVALANLPAAALTRAVREAGYGVQTTDSTTRHHSHDGWGVVLALLLALPLMGGMLAGWLAGVDLMPAPWVQALLATVALLGPGARFLIGAWRALRAGAANMDVLVALGTTSAWGLSMWLWQTAHHGHAHLYFEGVAMVIAFVRLGKWLEARVKHRAADAIRQLGALCPDRARRWDGQAEVMTDVTTLMPGDQVVLRVGDRAPGDGVVLDGAGAMDESLLTGESLPVGKQPGARVIAGALATEGRLILRLTALGDTTVLGRIAAAVEGAQASKAPVQALVDRIAAIFVPVVVGLAVLTLLWWWPSGPEVAIIHAAAVLVIACPCALGLAAPAAMMMGTNRAARLGILVRDAGQMERASGLTHVVLDKTGTLTLGKPELTGITALVGSEETALAQAAALQGASSHPLAAALLRRSSGLSLPEARDLRVLPGAGVAGVIGGESLRLTTPEAAGLPLPPLPSTGGVSVLADDRQIRAIFSFADQPRPNAAQAIAEMRALGLTPVLASGDAPGAVIPVAQALGIATYHARQSPTDKAALVAQLRAAGARVAMVGDGVNDAPALAAADLGIAMGEGADAALAVAGMALMRPDPLLIPAAIRLARQVQSRIAQGLFWAFIYNVVGIPLAMAGMLNPAMAGAAMAASSVSVLLNALR